MRMLGFTPSSRDCVTVTRAVDEEAGMCLTVGEVYENACDLPPAAETVVTVTRL